MGPSYPGMSWWVLLLLALRWGVVGEERDAWLELPIRVSWGYLSPANTHFDVKIKSREAEIVGLSPITPGDRDAWHGDWMETQAGGGVVRGFSCRLRYGVREIRSGFAEAQEIWRHLFLHSESNAVARVLNDPALRSDSRQLTLVLARDESRGFMLTVDQLLREKTFWIPELDVFVCAGFDPISWERYQGMISSWRGQRTLDRLARDSEATLDEYRSLWEDMGSPAYQNAHSVAPGHIVCLSWKDALYKFGVDRYGGARNDYGQADRFQLTWEFADQGGIQGWKSQRLERGLPLVVTTSESNGIRYSLEQFAFPLRGVSREVRCDSPAVLMQRLVLCELTGSARRLSVPIRLRRELASGSSVELRLQNDRGIYSLEEAGTGSALLLTSGKVKDVLSSATELRPLSTNGTRLVQEVATTLQVSVDLAAHGLESLDVLLPSPLLKGGDALALRRLRYDQARASALAYWERELARGAFFEVPEPAVNELFRANLWHAFRLPRRHGGATGTVDLPYSNFAYDQKGTPWPVNQAVYVDSMLYDLRGYHHEAARDLRVIFQNNQEPDGRVGGFANWGVYTPGMLYAVAKHHQLAGNESHLQELLPEVLKALDWCLAQCRKNQDSSGTLAGLLMAPLNDLSHEPRAWAFNQAYTVAGLQEMGKVLKSLEHPRADEALRMAEQLRAAVVRDFARAAVNSPLVPLADHTWVPYVPGDALSSGRSTKIWYPTDVDTGPLHLARLGVLDPKGELTGYLLHDHEDNLFYRNWGMANEPVYNQHGTVYLLRDEPKPVIRTFYSMMACAFSHLALEPVEHRWGWGQYFGPPSTDGAWFELYRNMLLRETEGEGLFLLQAAPRAWFRQGDQIHVRRAPTQYGLVNLDTLSRVDEGAIFGRINLTPPVRCHSLLVRFRPPIGMKIRSVTVNGRPHSDFDPEREWVRIPQVSETEYSILVRY